jgi:serine/threonine protein kinase
MGTAAPRDPEDDAQRSAPSERGGTPQSDLTLQFGPVTTMGGSTPHPGTAGQAGSGTGLPTMFDSSAAHAVRREDLSDDKLLLAAPRVLAEGEQRPALGGIPLLARIGQGGMGAVYYGIHPRLRKEMAIKVLPFNLAAAQPQLVQRFMREAQLAAQITSPHLVTVLDVNQEAGLFFLVMEYVAGRSARAYLEQVQHNGARGVEEATALDICIAAAEGLAAAHARGVVHRDIKPDNIFIPWALNGDLEFRAAKLGDLGLARSESGGPSLTGSMEVMGTPGFMAPEQAVDTKHASKAADVFSLGATLYALLAGQPPFTGESAMQVIFATMNKQHANVSLLRPDLSPPTLLLLEHCLAKYSNKRYGDGATLARALQTCRETLGQGRVAQNQACDRLASLRLTSAQGAPAPLPVMLRGEASSGPQPAPVVMRPMDMDGDDFVKTRPRPKLSVRHIQSMARWARLAVPLVMIATAVVWMTAFSGGRFPGIVSPGGHGYMEVMQTVEEVRAKSAGADAEGLDECIAELEGLRERYPDWFQEEGEFLLQDLRVRRHPELQPPKTTKPLVPEQKPPTVVKVGQEYFHMPEFNRSVRAERMVFKLKRGPPGLTVDPNTGAVTWTPKPEAVGRYDVWVIVDADGKEMLGAKWKVEVQP